MKKLWGLIAFSFLLSSFTQSQINFSKLSGSENLIKDSNILNKPIFIYIHADWLNMCIAMENSIFNNPEVANYYNSNFLCYKADSDDKKNMELKGRYHIDNNLYFLFLDTNYQVLNEDGGYYTNPQEFIELGQKAYFKFYPEKSEWKLNENIYNTGNREPIFLKKYAISMLDGNYSDEQIAKVVNDFWSVADTSVTDDWDKIEMIKIFETEFGDKINFFIENKETIIESRDIYYYYEKLTDLIEINLAKAIKNNDTKLYNQLKKFASEHFKDGKYVEFEDLKQHIDQSWKERMGN
jgi:hypothetical protein